jgi:hypothetical protein
MLPFCDNDIGLKNLALNLQNTMSGSTNVELVVCLFRAGGIKAHSLLCNATPSAFHPARTDIYIERIGRLTVFATAYGSSSGSLLLVDAFTEKSRSKNAFLLLS